jgi:hypothetical protein
MLSISGSAAGRRTAARLVAGVLGFHLAATGLAVAGESGLSATTRNALGQKIELTYTVTGIGLPILSADFKIDLARDHYEATSVIRTEGIAGLLMQSRWDTKTEGAVTSAGLRPANFRADVSTARGRGAVTVNWSGEDYRISAIPENRPERLAALREKLVGGLPDPLTAMITNALTQVDQPCRGTQRVFDGRRIFDLAFSFDQAVEIKGAPHYNGYAYRCSVRHVPVAGQPPEEIAREESSPSASHSIWLAPVRLGASGVRVLIPVRIDLAAAGWGRTSVFLTESSIDGESIMVAARTARN